MRQNLERAFNPKQKKGGNVIDFFCDGHLHFSSINITTKKISDIPFEIGFCVRRQSSIRKFQSTSMRYI